MAGSRGPRRIDRGRVGVHVNTGPRHGGWGEGLFSAFPSRRRHLRVCDDGGGRSPRWRTHRKLMLVSLLITPFIIYTLMVVKL